VTRTLRKRIFGRNMRYIAAHNRDPKHTYKLGINHRADQTHEEYLALLNTQRPRAQGNGAAYIHDAPRDTSSLPSDIDWREMGAVTEVKDQGVCGSCWSFGAHQTIEGSWFLATGELIRLSSQSLIDCTWNQGNTGCSGGLDFEAYQWLLMYNDGIIPTEENYPYLMANGMCHTDRAGAGAIITGYVNVSSGDAAASQDALVNQGPISVSIDASHKSFSFYSSGVYFEPQCGNGIDDLDHTVLAVGYGTENGQPYWIVKNSWSTYWGDQGYVKMSAVDNNCGVETSPTYTLVD